MRRFVTFLLLLALSLSAHAQELQPAILAMGSPTVVGDEFNNQVSQVAYGYRMAFVDKSIPQTIRYVYKSDENESLRVDYKYEKKGRTPVVVMQKISGESVVISRIYNFLFNTSMTPNDMARYITTDADVSYRGRNYRFSFVEDDFAPGYWTMTFF